MVVLFSPTKQQPDLPVTAPAVTDLRAVKRTTRIRTDHLDRRLMAVLKMCFARRAVILETAQDSISASQQLADPKVVVVALGRK